MRKHAAKVVVLALFAATALMAFTATGANAEGAFTVVSSTALATNKTFSGVNEGRTRLVVPALNIEFECKKLTVLEGKILNGVEGKALAKFLYEECRLFVEKPAKGEEEEVEEGGEELPCVLEEGESEAGGHITLLAKLLVVLHNGASYLLATPDVGTSFGIVKFKKGTGCTLPLANELKGALMLEVAKGDINRDGEKIENLWKTNKVIQELFSPSDIFKFGANTAYIVGSMKLTLTGTHAGLRWGAV